MQNSRFGQAGRSTDLLKIGDLLGESVYRQPPGAAAPVLLLAAGQRIETALQLRQLREAGHPVALPLGSDLREASDCRRHPLVDSEPPDTRGGTPTGGDSRGAPPRTLGRWWSRPASDSKQGSCTDPGLKMPAAAATPVSECATIRFPAQLPNEFSERMMAAVQVQQAVTSAARELLGRVRTGTAPDMDALQQAGSTLVSQVTEDVHAVAALTFLHQCDDYTIQHSADVAILMVAIGRVLELPQSDLRVLALAGLMHDVGKQLVSPAILRKPGRLSGAEFAEMRKHPQYGFDLLSGYPHCPEAVRLVALQHHERLDGSGYPSGLTGSALHPYSCIAAVADTFDAMTSDRIYRKSCPTRQAIIELYGARMRRFVPSVVEALIKLVGVYPVGTRVVLSTGERGVVISPNPDDTTRPSVLVDHDRNGCRLATRFVLSPQVEGCRIVGTEQQSPAN